MFCHITQNWRGRPLTSRLAVVELIGATTTKSGLQVRCQDRWGQPVYHFENAIPHRADFGHAAESNQFAVNYNEQIIGGVFRNLAQEVEWRISAYAGSGVKVFA